jgi:dsRNA-specific ribonuclease
VHCSAAPTAHNGTLAWLGDSALGLVLTEQLVALDPRAAVGGLAPRRATLQSRQACLAHAEALGLREALVLGKSVRGEPATLSYA